MIGMIVLLPIFCYFRATGDRGHDADGVAVFSRRVFLLQIANILVVEVNIHEAANAAILGIEVLAQVRIGSGKLFQGLANRSGIELHACLLARKLPQSGRNFQLYSHSSLASSVTPQWNLSTVIERVSARHLVTLPGGT